VIARARLSGANPTAIPRSVSRTSAPAANSAHAASARSSKPPQDVGLGTEVVEEARAADAGAQRDLGDGGPLIPLLEKQLARRLGDRLARRDLRAARAGLRGHGVSVREAPGRVQRSRRRIADPGAGDDGVSALPRPLCALECQLIGHPGMPNAMDAASSPLTPWAMSRARPRRSASATSDCTRAPRRSDPRGRRTPRRPLENHQRHMSGHLDCARPAVSSTPAVGSARRVPRPVA
jgi:hypothetical protein